MNVATSTALIFALLNASAARRTKTTAKAKKIKLGQRAVVQENPTHVPKAP
jgi:hypothetical protein